MTLHRCPLGTSDSEMVVRFLKSIPFEELLFIAGDIQSKLSASEQIACDINRFCSSYADTEGRINFILTLIDNATILPLQVPLSAMRDPEMMQVTHTPVYEDYTPPQFAAELCEV